MSTFNTNITDPMLADPPWCDLEEHDQCEMLRDVKHWRDCLTLEDLHTDSAEDPENPTTRLYVDVYKDGVAADTTVRLGVGDLYGGSALLTIEQAATVIQSLQDAIDIIAEYGEYRPRHRLEVAAA